MTLLVVTHEMSFARDVSSRVMFHHKGSVEAKGPPTELFGSACRSNRFRQFISGQAQRGHSAALRDFLMHLAITNLFRARWTDMFTTSGFATC